MGNNQIMVTHKNFQMLDTDCICTEFRADFCSKGYFTYESKSSENFFIIDDINPCWCREIAIIDDTYYFRDLCANRSLFFEEDTLAIEEYEEQDYTDPETQHIEDNKLRWIIEYDSHEFIPDEELEEFIEAAYTLIRNGE